MTLARMGGKTFNIRRALPSCSRPHSRVHDARAFWVANVRFAALIVTGRPRPLLIQRRLALAGTGGSGRTGSTLRRRDSHGCSAADSPLGPLGLLGAALDYHHGCSVQ